MSGIIGIHGKVGVLEAAWRLQSLSHRGAVAHEVTATPTRYLGLVADDPASAYTGQGAAAAIDGWFSNLEEIAGKHRIAGSGQAELLLRLCRRKGPAVLQQLKGEFAYAILDRDATILGRDRLGVKPLYYLRERSGHVFASEMKALVSPGGRIRSLEPGAILTLPDERRLRPERNVVPEPQFGDPETVAPRIRDLLRQAVGRRLKPRVKTGVFLSGGIDSAVIAATARELSDKLVFFSVGTRDSNDLRFARRLCRLWRAEFHSLTYTEHDVLATVPDAVYHLESYDAPLVRSAIANLLVARLAGKHGIRRVLIGEGGDELFAGYDQLKQLSGLRLHRALWSLLRKLHNGGLQRCDRIPQSQGIEAAIPFFDYDLVQFAFSVRPELKIVDGTEKWILRKAFEGSLPAEVVWRAKQKFSAGAGSMDVVRLWAEEHYQAGDLARARRQFPAARVRTLEELHYFRIFRSHFPQSGLERLLGRTEMEEESED